MDAKDDLFECAPDPMVLLDARGAVLRANAAFRAAFRHVIGPDRPPWGRAPPPPFIDGARRFDAAAPDGSIFEWRETVLPNGDRLAAARNVNQRIAAAAQAGRAKTVLFATLTHELRTPLNGILGMSNLLAQSLAERDIAAPAEREYLDAIRQSGERLLGLITDILDYSRLDGGGVQLDEIEFSPLETAQSVAELVSPKAYEKRLELVISSGRSTPARLRGDEGRLRQILFNLVGNAVKFTEAGAVIIEIAPVEPPNAAEESDRRRLRFTVRDTGPGVAPEHRAAIFQEFAQADAAIARRYGGAGLGLAIVRKLAQAMGGDVGLEPESAGARGAAFWVELPFAAVAEAENASPSPELKSALSGIVALVATPQPWLFESIAGALISCGAQPRRVENLAEARAAGPAGLILLDHAVAVGAAADFARLGAPVIVLVPQEERAALAHYRETGIRHYLLKPLRRASLIERASIAAKGERRAGSAIDERAEEPRQSGLRVLLAEDNPVNALLARVMLTRLGCSVELARDGHEAVTAASRGGHDLIFLDLRMPVMDGLAAARAIRALEPRIGHTPLIALTAEAGAAERAEALAAGMDDFVSKPIEPGHLGAVVARFTRRANMASLAAG